MPANHPRRRADRKSVKSPDAGKAALTRLRVDRMDAALRRHVETGLLPGVVALVRHRDLDRLVVFGNMAFGSDEPMRRDTIFRLASMTKPVTAVGAMILVEECKLRLDDPVEGWLPELKDRKVLRKIDGPVEDTVPAKRLITLRDLLTFRCGYGEVGFISPTCPLQNAMIQARLPLSEWPVLGTPEDLMKRLASLPLAHQPGERWLYHMGYEILGVLISRASGKSLATFLRERIFDPLGMKDTGFHVPESKLDRLPPCYGRDFSTGEVVVLHEGHGGFFARPPDFESGAGGLVSTVDDMLAFGQMMLNNGAYGSERILSRPSIETMTTDHIAPEQKAASPFFENFWTDYGFGFGMGVVTARNHISGSPGRFGWDGAFGTSWHVDPREKLVGIFMTQRRPDALRTPDFVLDFWTSAYQLIDD